MLEEHLYWVMVMDRYINCDGLHMLKYTRGNNSPADQGGLKGFLANRAMKKKVDRVRGQAHAQGMSRLVWFERSTKMFYVFT